MKRTNKIIKNKTGSVILFAIFVITLFFIITSALALLIINESKQATAIKDSSSAYLAAEAGLERARNYAYNNKPVNTASNIYKGNQPLDDVGQAKYSFEVAKASVAPGTSYDPPSGKCITQNTDSTLPNYNVSYCYYSLGKNGGMVRKLEGVLVNDTDINKKKFLIHSSITDFTGFPIAGVEKVKLLDLSPVSPAAPLNSVSLTTYVYGQGGTNLSSISNGSSYQWGLLDKIISTDTQRYNGIAILLRKDSAGKLMVKLTRAQLNNSITTGSTMMYPDYLGTQVVGTSFQTSLTPNVDLDFVELKRTSGDIKGIKFTLTYRPAPTNYLDRTVTLKANDTTDDQCLGIITAYTNSDPSLFNLGDELGGNLYNMYIARGYNSLTGHFSVNPTVNTDYIDIKNLSDVGGTPSISLLNQFLLSTK